MSRFVLVFCLVVILTLTKLASALSEESKAQMKERYDKLENMCIKDNVISEEDMVKIREHKDPTGSNSGCFIACLMKTVGFIDDAGMLQIEAAFEHMKPMFTDPKELKLAEKYLLSCAYVNDKDVSDGAKGCERALLAYSCMRDNAPEYGFNI